MWLLLSFVANSILYFGAASPVDFSFSLVCCSVPCDLSSAIDRTSESTSKVSAGACTIKRNDDVRRFEQHAAELGKVDVQLFG